MSKINELVQRVSDELEADVYIYSGPMASPLDDHIINCTAERRHSTALLLLATSGGSANVAFRIARHFQRLYDHFIVAVAGHCKSAGSILSLGAHEVVMGLHGELGPLDVQITKDDEFFKATSGLAPQTALDSLAKHVMATFRAQFLELKFGADLTTKTATETATALAVGVFQPIYAQLEPLRIAEMHMALQIAYEYGNRLADVSGNVKDDAVDRLVGGYPAHDFVIDLEEAEQLFVNIRPPSEAEAELMFALLKLLRRGADPARVTMLEGVPQQDLPFPDDTEQRDAPPDPDPMEEPTGTDSGAVDSAREDAEADGPHASGSYEDDGVGANAT